MHSNSNLYIVIDDPNASNNKAAINSYCTLNRSSRDRDVQPNSMIQNQSPVVNSAQIQITQPKHQHTIIANDNGVVYTRRSVSMESLLANNNSNGQSPAINPVNENSSRYYQTQQHQQISSHPANSQSRNESHNMMHKYGTVSGGGYAYSHQRPSMDSVQNAFVEKSKPQTSTEANGMPNSRMRAINRSFRTAVDKSFDVAATANAAVHSASSGLKIGKFKQFLALFSLLLSSTRFHVLTQHV